MIVFDAIFAESARPKLLCLGAHSDDLEIGAGATILHFAKRHAKGEITWVVFSGVGERRDEATLSAGHFTAGFSRRSIEIHDFADGFFPYQGERIKAVFEKLKHDLQPDIVFTHFREDLHQDHRMISDLTWQTFRDHLILEYEIPKYDGDVGRPNLFVPISDECRKQKIAALQKYFGTQRNKNWFSEETFNAIMRLRGVESRSSTGYAEAFYCRKVLIRI